MKTKKIFTGILCLLLIFCMVGCGEAKTSSAVGNNLNKSMTDLAKIVNNLEEINYNEIIIDDISPLSDSTFNTVSNTSSIQKTKWYRVGGNATANTETKPKVTNAKYVNSDKNKIGLQNYKAQKLNTISNNQQNDCVGDNCNNNYTTQKTTYKPRYVNQVSENFNRNSIDNYFAKIEVLYNTCADCISCEAECKTAKSNLNQTIQECKVLCNKLKDGTIKLSESEINECNSCITEIKSCASRLGTTKGNINAKSKELGKLKGNYNSNLAGISNAYSKLLDALETRLECYQSCSYSINSVCDIINKTNVNMKEALENKSNERDIIDPEFSQNQESNLDANSSSEQPSRVIVPEEINNNNSTAWNTNNSQNANNNASQINKQNATNAYNNQTNTQQNKTTNSQNTQPQYRHKTKDIQEQDRVLDNYNNGNSQVVYPNNTTYPYNNGYNYGNGYNNYPYPPRNIDTYHTIYKNIDTYRPNYPIENNNVLNAKNNKTNTSQSNSKQTTDNAQNTNQISKNSANTQNVSNKSNTLNNLSNKNNLISKNNRQNINRQTRMKNNLYNSKNATQNITKYTENTEQIENKPETLDIKRNQINNTETRILNNNDVQKNFESLVENKNTTKEQNSNASEIQNNIVEKQDINNNNIKTNLDNKQTTERNYNEELGVMPIPNHTEPLQESSTQIENAETTLENTQDTNGNISPLPNPYDESKIKEQNDKIKENQTTMQSQENRENSNKNTTMQNNSNENSASEQSDVIDLGNKSQILQKSHA